MITLKPNAKAKLKGIAVMLVMFGGIILVTGCSSMTRQIELDKIDYVMAHYLPEGTTVEFYSEYAIQELLGNNRYGQAFCSDWVKRDKCTIKVIRNAETFLHEICHILEPNPEWHGKYSHSGLQGCKLFDYDTLANI